MNFFTNVWEQIYNTLIAENRWMVLVYGLLNTLLISLGAIIIGTIIGCFLALFKTSRFRVLRGIANAYTSVIRGIPLATQLMIFSFVIFGPMGFHESKIIAIIGFGINSGAYVTEIIRAGIQGVDIGQSEAGRSLGLSKAQTMIKIILPQAIKAALPTYTSEFIALIKETSIVSFIGVTDLTMAGNMIRNATYNAWVPLISVAVLYLALTLGLTKIFSKLERRFARSDRG